MKALKDFELRIIFTMKTEKKILTKQSNQPFWKQCCYQMATSRKEFLGAFGLFSNEFESFRNVAILHIL